MCVQGSTDYTCLFSHFSRSMNVVSSEKLEEIHMYFKLFLAHLYMTGSYASLSDCLSLCLSELMRPTLFCARCDKNGDKLRQMTLACDSQCHAACFISPRLYNPYKMHFAHRFWSIAYSVSTLRQIFRAQMGADVITLVQVKAILIQLVAYYFD